MGRIKVEKPETSELQKMDITAWPIWEKEKSRFNWSYDVEETCYIIKGKAKVEADDGEVVEFGAGDLVTLPKGLNCVWDISDPIRKHYKFG